MQLNDEDNRGSLIIDLSDYYQHSVAELYISIATARVVIKFGMDIIRHNHPVKKCYQICALSKLFS